LGGVAAVALGSVAVGTASTANAFTESNWTWTLNNTSNIDERVTIDITIDPVGKILDEVMQIQIGDVEAEAKVSNVHNLKPLELVKVKSGYEVDYALTVDGGYKFEKSLKGSAGATYKYGEETTNSWEHTLNGSLETEGEGVPFFIGGAGAIGGFFVSGGPSGAAGAGVLGAIGAYATDGDASFDASLGGSSTYGTDTNGYFLVEGGYEVAGQGNFEGHLNLQEKFVTTTYHYFPAIQDALKELPKVEAVATAVGNLVSIESDTAVQESSLQVLFDDVDPHRRRRGEGGNNIPVVASTGGGHVDFEDADFDLDADLSLQDSKYDLDSGNYNHDVALLLGLAAGAGLIEQADIKAESEAEYILNAQVLSSATAIGNVKSIGVETDVPDNGLVIADITQLSVANISADASAKNIELVNYTNLGKLEDPIVAATATAIGNAVNISVNSGQFTPSD
jgi:hypothetical protein